MKKFLVLFAVVASLAAIPVSNVLVKGHVPAHKEQVCHRGEVITVGTRAVRAHLRHSDAFIDKNDFSTICFTGNACGGPGDCDDPGPGEGEGD